MVLNDMVKQVENEETNIYDEPQVIEKYIKLPESLQGVVIEGARHARRRGENVPSDTEILKFFE